MAKHPEDRRTPELLPVPKRRGRPTTGQAMTAAERKRAQRKRDRAQGAFEDATLSGLVEALSSAVRVGAVVYAEEITEELMRRAAENKARIDPRMK